MIGNHSPKERKNQNIISLDTQFNICALLFIIDILLKVIYFLLHFVSTFIPISIKRFNTDCHPSMLKKLIKSNGNK